MPWNSRRNSVTHNGVRNDSDTEITPHELHLAMVYFCISPGHVCPGLRIYTAHGTVLWQHVFVAGMG